MKLNLDYYISKESNMPEAEYKLIDDFINKYQKEKTMKNILQKNME